MSKRALITGISGFAGSHLAEYLLARDFQVTGIILNRENPNLEKISHQAQLFEADLRDKKKVVKILSQVKPDQIYHLAGLTIPRLSFDKAKETFEVNLFSTLSLFESLVELGLRPAFVNIGSAEEYGITTVGRKISEKTEFNPASPYAVSKLAQDYLGLFYFRSYQIPVIRLRPFNHIGPRQDESLAISSFAKQVAKIEKGLQKPVILVGNLAARRDFTDVADMVEAYYLAAKKCTPGEIYNIGRGVAYSLAQILEILLSFSKIRIKVKVDKSLFRPLEVPALVCDPKKFMKATGWKPKIPIETTLANILNYWRAQPRLN